MLVYFIALFGFVPTARPADRLVSAGAVVLLVGNFLCRSLRRRSIRLNGVILWYAGFVVCGFLSSVFGAHMDGFLSYFTSTFLLTATGVVCVTDVMRRAPDAEEVFRLIVVAGCVAAARFCWYTPWHSYYRGLFGVQLDHMTNYNSYTTHLAVICLIAAYYALVKREKWCVPCFGFLAAITVVGGSRKNLIVVPVVCVLFALTQKSANMRWKTIAVVCVLLAVGWYALDRMYLLVPLKERTMEMFAGVLGTSRNRVDRSTAERLYLQKAAWKTWLAHPLFGVGMNGFRACNLLHISAHNNGLELLASGGVFGFAVYYGKYLCTFLRIWNNKRKNSCRINLLCAGTLLGILVQEYGAVNLYKAERMVLILLLFAAVSRHDRMKTYRIRL